MDTQEQQLDTDSTSFHGTVDLAMQTTCNFFSKD
uniref:Uncharacterized protein n=1 Tax=Physcomitrium patens TaxID=3218 RepID=A0A2K1IPD8_PHYPA|nr:hypothetical protein PHYPA_027459 [Physcomitrium patens]